MSLTAIVDHLVSSARTEAHPKTPPDKFFEIFTADLITRDFGFDWDDIESGIVDGQNDGQIDAIYILLDDQLVKEIEDIDLKTTRRNANIRVVVQQSKNANSFSENSFSKMRSSICDLFDLQNNLRTLSKTFNESVIARADTFRKLYLGLQGRNPTVTFQIFYTTKGDRNTASARIKSDSTAIRSFLEAQYPQPTCEINLLGAREIVDYNNRPRFIHKDLEFTVTPASDSSNLGWVGLVQLDEFYRFISDENQRLVVAMLEENVRDFEGDGGVNGEIAETLNSNDSSIDFWWLNNGITILCDDAIPHTQRRFSLDRPLIVNGLQTANKVWQHFANDPRKDSRHILVKIVKVTNEVIRDKIIRATNRQTPINETQLKATEKIHRDIEAFFKARSKYYERRKNHYKNSGRPKQDTFSISELAQAVLSIHLQRPNDARARPGTALKNTDDYNSIFNSSAELSFYYYCAETLRTIDNFLLEKSNSRKERNNLRFYMAMTLPRLLAQKANLTTGTLQSCRKRNPTKTCYAPHSIFVDACIFQRAATTTQRRAAPSSTACSKNWRSGLQRKIGGAYNWISNLTHL